MKYEADKMAKNFHKLANAIEEENEYAGKKLFRGKEPPEIGGVPMINSRDKRLKI